MTNSSPCSPLRDPDEIAKRLIQRAHHRDGLPELAVGLTFLITCAFIYAQSLLARGSAAFKAAVVAFSLVIPLLCIGSPLVLKWVRRRYLMDRVGYVEWQPIGRKQIGFGIAIAVGVTVALFGVAPRLSQPDRWVLAGTGLFGGALAALSGRMLRFVVGGVVVAAAGISVALSGVSLETGFAILFGVQGLLAVISGSVVFWRFIRQPGEPGE